MLQPQRSDCFGHATRLIPINRLWTSFRHRTESAPPRTDVTQQHERRGLMIPALPNIRTLRRLAHRMQSKSACQLLQIVEVISDRSFCPKPLRLRLPDGWTKFDLNELRSSCHPLLQF